MRFRLLIFALLLAVPALRAQPNWAERPTLQAPPRFTMPPMQRFTLSNGLPVMLVEKHGVPIVQVNLVVKAGSVNDPAGKVGLAAVAADMMDEGAGNRTALELADAVEFLGVQLSTGAGLHSTEVALHTPVAKLEPALDLMADVALRPTFPQEELERLRARRLTALAQRRDQPRSIASVLFDRTLFGPQHPYGRGSSDPAGIRGLTRDDLAGFHQTYIRPANAAFIVVGDVTPAQVQPLLEARFGRVWAAGSNPVPARVAAAAQVARRTIYLVDKPGAAQSVIRIGRIGAARSTPDYYALQVLNTILGGSFTSRLNQNLRETHGYAYGAGSSFGFRPVAGPFVATSDVQTDVTAPALTEFFNELRGIRNPIPAEELDKARSFVALSFPEPFGSVRGTAAMLAELFLNDLPDDTFNHFTERILAVTAADVQRVARQYVDPDKVAVIVVGDRSKVEAGIRALNLGTIQTLTIDDVLGPAQ
ncbi:MAG TPA: pitrilysin family protein [Rhodothermales bacterium]|nr:pitrilysin family protein [Rhodothermales bacterium]